MSKQNHACRRPTSTGRRWTSRGFAQTSNGVKKVFKIIVWLVVIFLILFVGFASLGFYRMYQKNKTEEAISRIESVKITIDDVMGKNLPPKPDQALSDSTIAGFDVNNNKIRDDVELTIFTKYPNSAKIRSGMLQ